MNWKRGMTRLYIVAWAGWMVFILMRSASIFSWSHVLPALTAIFLAGVLAPAILLWGLRWTIDGFRPTATG